MSTTPAGDAVASTSDAAAGIVHLVAEHQSPGRPIPGGEVAAWLLTEGYRAPSAALLFDELCWRLVGRGVPLSRAAISVSTLHPQIVALSMRWLRSRRIVQEYRVGHGISHTADYIDSPMRATIEHGKTVRYRLDGTDAIEKFPLLVAMREAGATDYLACPLTFFNGRHQTITWATEQPGGFTDADIAAITALLPALAIVVEARVRQRLAASLLDTYLGPTIGRHILDGEVLRGEGRHIRAVLMATDLRGFTALSDRLPGSELIALLNEYFDAVTAPVQARGGEVLKFVGDGVLAIFQPDGSGEPAAALAALDAAAEGLARLVTINRRRRTEGREAIRIGVGLHLGEVIYGNVGAADRLDFTAIGPAVNLVCRLETLTKRLDRPLLASRDFAAICAHPLMSLGFHPVKGLSEPEEVFGLAEGAMTAS